MQSTAKLRNPAVHERQVSGELQELSEESSGRPFPFPALIIVFSSCKVLQINWLSTVRRQNKPFETLSVRRVSDIVRQANTSEVADLRREARDLKEVVAEQTLDMLGIARTTFYR